MPEFDFNFPEKRICSSCVLPEDPPRIFLDDQGVCNVCASVHNKESRPLLEVDFVKMVNKYRDKKSRYDCLLMCSGGKDSVYSLYYLVKKCGFNPLVFTFDHHFENPEAMENVARATGKLGVDSVFLRTKFMHEAFKEVMQQDNQASICQLCSIWYIQEVYKIAQTYRTPAVVAGWTKGQMSLGGSRAGEEYQAMTAGTSKFIKEVLRQKEKYKDFPLTMKEGVAKCQKKYKIKIISPHWFLDSTPDECAQVIKKELDWREPEESYPKGSSNCSLNFLSVYKSLKDHGYTHYHIELSNLIRRGEISREEALKKLETEFSPSFLNDIYKKLFDR
jgi:tRNA(Ile)-lysidine synthase TilS/MesJ